MSELAFFLTQDFISRGGLSDAPTKEAHYQTYSTIVLTKP